MARTTLADLTQDVRGLTNASTAVWSLGTASYWDDDQLQIILDRHRRDVYQEYLAPVERLSGGGGSVVWKVYRSQWTNWETTDGGTATFVVQDASGSVMPSSGYTADYRNGLVTFAADQAGSARILTGSVFDVYGAAVEVLRRWASHEALSFDFTEDGQTFRRSQKVTALRGMADEYAMLAWPAEVQMIRGDVGGEIVARGDDAKHKARR